MSFDLDNDPTIIKKYNSVIGLAYWSTVTGTWVLDEQGKPIAVPRPQRTPATPREVVISRKVENWSNHETGSSLTLNTSVRE